MLDIDTIFTAFAYLFPLVVLFVLVGFFELQNRTQILFFGLLVYVVVVIGGSVVVRYYY